jgi:hypothetical protein
MMSDAANVYGVPTEAVVGGARERRAGLPRALQQQAVRHLLPVEAVPAIRVRLDTRGIISGVGYHFSLALFLRSRQNTTVQTR